MTTRVQMRLITAGQWLVLAYAFVQPFGHNAAAKALLLLILMAVLLWRVVRDGWRPDFASPLMRAGGIFLAMLAAAAVFSPFPADSLDTLRKEALPAAVLLLAVPAFFAAAPEKLDGIAWAYGGGLVLRALVVLVQQLWAFGHISPEAWAVINSSGWAAALGAGLVPQIGGFKGYALDATLYLPFFLALLLSAKLSLGTRLLLLALALVALAELLAYGSRAPLLAIGVFLIAYLLLGQQLRTLLGLAALAVTLLSAVALVQPQLFSRYVSIFSPSTYADSTSSVAYRRLIWQGTLEIAADRPWLGYGPGWKKLGVVAKDERYMARWRTQPAPAGPAMVDYFSGKPDGINPHNLWVQIAFESGGLGVAAYAAFLLVILRLAVTGCRHEASGGLHWHDFTVAFLLGYLAINLANGIWLAGAVIPVLAGIGEVLRQKASSCPPRV